MTIPEGTAFGRYVVRSLVGTGGMGEIYLASDVQLKRPVALKLLSPKIAANEEGRLRLEQEARAASALNHPNIITVFEIGRIGERHFMATEFVDGITLRHRMERSPMELEEIVHVMLQVAAALAASEEAGIVHRDIKPENVMLRKDGYVKVLDFGLAKSLEPRDPALVASDPNLVFGTIYYMSPEQLRGKAIDSRADVWSAGVMLYEMLARKLPFDGATTALVASAILKDDPEPLSALRPVPPRLEEIVGRCLARDRDRRFRRASELHAALKSLSFDLQHAEGFRAAVRQIDTEKVSLGAGPARTDSDPFAGGRLPELPPSNLPVDLTPFIGREEEAALLIRRLSRPDVRLMTLTGPGGTGKSRLAIQIAIEVLPRFSDGAFFVPLAAISDRALILSEIARVTGASETGPEPVAQTVTRHLRARRLLLLLDNFDQAIESAPLVSELLAAIPGLKVIATSRSALRLTGEHEHSVAPLTLPSPGAAADPDAVMRSSAVALFVQRAIAARPDFILTGENAGAVAAICARLDGLPLAIELAAARVKLLSPAAILLRLEQPLDLLVGGPRDLPRRQQTMRDAIAWGYELLDERDKLLFSRLGIFIGGFALEAAEALCEDERALKGKVFDGIASLVEKSFLRQDHGPGGEARFSMFSTIREFALELLDAAGERDILRHRHARTYLAMVEKAEPALTGSAQKLWLDRFAVEHDNLRAALECLSEEEDGTLSARMAGALWWFWYLRGHYDEGRKWLHLAVERTTGVVSRPRARALLGSAVLSLLQCDYSSARQLLDECVTVSREIRDRPSLAAAFQFLGSIAREEGKYQESLDLHHVALTLMREMSDRAGIARSLNYISFASWLSGDFALAAEKAAEARAAFATLEDGEGLAWAAINLAAAAHYQQSYDESMALGKEALALSREADFKEGIAWSLNLLGITSRQRKDRERAAGFLRKSLEYHWDLGDRWRSASVIEALAGVLADMNRWEEASRFFGASAALRRTIAAPVPEVERFDVDHDLAGLRTLLADTFSGLFAAGEHAPIEQIVETALLRSEG